MDIILCKPWGKDQGDFVRLDASQFDPAVHELYDPAAAPAEPAAQDDAPKGKTKKRAAPAATTEG